MCVVKLEHHSPLGTRTLVNFPSRGLRCQEGVLLSITHLGAELLHCNTLSVSLGEVGRDRGRKKEKRYKYRLWLFKSDHLENS